MHDPQGHEPGIVSDAELLDRVRNGDARAFGELWARHAGPALSVARSFTGLDAEDIVSESFERLLVAVQNGKGPRGAFRPYLITTVRNVGRRQYNREPARVDADFELMVDGRSPSGEQIAVADQHHRAVGDAFAALPDRWKEALWYSEVDGMQPREISGLLGMSANAVSALLIRAKRGLRDAWVSAQLTHAASPECRVVVRDLGAFTRKGLSARASRRVEEHIAGCDSCRAALSEAREISQTLAVALLPVMAGAAGAIGYVSTLRPPAMPEMLLPVETIAAGPVMVAAPSEPQKEDAESRTVRRSLALLVLIGVVLLGGAGVVLASGRQPMPDAAVEASADPEVRPSPMSSGTPAPGPSADPTPTATPSPDPDAPDSSDPAPTSAPAVTMPDAAEPTRPSTTVPEIHGAPASPSATVSQFDGRMYPRLSGQDAIRGARIEVVDEEGTVLGSTTADPAGRWSIHMTSGGPGTAVLFVRQSVDGVTSPPAALGELEVADPPVPVAPLAGSGVSAERFRFGLNLPGGTVVERRIVGMTPVQALELPLNGVWNEYLSVPPGAYSLLLRYANPQTRDFGPWNEVRFIAE